MKVALCCIGRMENLYIKEYVEYYKNLGISTIFLYDNNHDGEEYFEDAIGDYINDGFVELIDFRNKTVCQLKAYQDCYDKHGDEYDWICFFDCDEFMVMKEYSNICDFLSQEKFDDFSLIHINWKCYDDNDLVVYDERPVMERFTRVKMPLDFKKTYEIPENYHVKSIVRGCCDVRWERTPHTPSRPLMCCDANGKDCNGTSPFNPYNYDSAWLNHYPMKTIDEWVRIKSKRGYPDGNKDFFKEHDIINEFFKMNEMIKEKQEYIEKINNIPNDNLDIFICTHKEFEPLVKNPIYKIINSNSINGDIAPNGLKGSFYSEILSYFYVNKNYQLKDYIGFCHYRKYWSFMDDVPNIGELFKDCDAIVAKPMKLSVNLYQQYAICHNHEDMDIVKSIVEKKHQEYNDAFIYVLNSKMLFPCNMFIMRTDDFNEYCKFIETVLNEYLDVVGLDIEKRIEENKDKYLKNFYPNNTVEYQYRIGGYLAERLTNVFIYKHFKKVKLFDINITEEKYKENNIKTIV